MIEDAVEYVLFISMLMSGVVWWMSGSGHSESFLVRYISEMIALVTLFTGLPLGLEHFFSDLFQLSCQKDLRSRALRPGEFI